MKEDEFEELVKTNTEYRHSEKYNMYIDKDATMLYAVNNAGGGSKWMNYQIHVDEYTGFRYVNYKHKKISLLRVLQDAWGTEYKLKPLCAPPYFRDEFNRRRKERRRKAT